MKKYVSFILILILLIGSFYYADKVSNFIINKSPLMKTLKSNKDKYEIKSVDAIVSDEYIIPGIEGKKVSEIESYYNMKKYNTFVSNKLIYKSIIPSISLEKNKDLIINKANPFKKGVSLLVSNNKGVITYSKNLDISLAEFKEILEELDPDEIILLDITGVGTQKGYNQELLDDFKDLKDKLIIAGGLNNKSVSELEDMGIKKVLVGTALHSGEMNLLD